MHLNNRRLSTLKMKGRIHFRENNSDLFYKVYKKDHLLDESGSIKNRIRQIHKLSRAMAFMPKTSFSYEGDFLVMQQKLLIRDKEFEQIDPSQRVPLIQQFARSLDKLCQDRFIHGDINRKNIIYSGGRLCLIDLEPSLLQVKDRVKQWMSTRPYRYSEDINNNNITTKSDFLGFGCFVKWFLGSSHPPQFYATRCSEMINRLEINSTPFQTLVPLLVES